MTRGQVLLLDVLLDALALTLALRFAGRRVRALRLVCGAALGAVLAYLCANWLNCWRMAAWLPIAALMMAIAGGRPARPVRDACLLLAAEGLLGGIVQALWGALGSRGAALLAGGLSAVCIAASGLRARRAACDVRRIRVLCRYRGRQAAFDAIVDSGNTLRDYLTQRPVIVAPAGVARERLGLADVPLRPILAQTAGGRQAMDCFTAQETRLCIGARRVSVQAVIALSPGLAPDAPALVPETLLTDARA